MSRRLLIGKFWIKDLKQVLRGHEAFKKVFMVTRKFNRFEEKISFLY